MKRFSLYVSLAVVPTALFGSTEEPPDAAAVQDERPMQMLVFADGDRVRGHLIGRDGEFLVFQSERFGELVVPNEGVEIRDLPAPAETAVAEVPPPPVPAETEVKEQPAPVPEEAVEMRDRARPYWASPVALAMALSDFLGAWTGRFSVSASVVTKTREQRDLALGLRVRREWEDTHAEINFRYDLRKTEGVTNTDVLKSNGVIRRELGGPYFAHYRPSAEWNRDYELAGLDAEYVLLQQELGLGVNLVDTDQREIRLGVAENVFSRWTLADDTSSHRDNQSLFGEVEFELPWRITISDRYIWFYSFSDEEQGWENQLELNKRFSDALTLGIRQEARRNNPDSRVQDYSLWRFLVGFDF